MQNIRLQHSFYRTLYNGYIPGAKVLLQDSRCGVLTVNRDDVYPYVKAVQVFETEIERFSGKEGQKK